MTLSSGSDLLKPGMESVVCDLCHSDQSEVVTRQRDLLLEVTNHEFTIVKCSRCGLIYLNPRPSKDLLGSYYPTVYYPPVQAKARPQFQQQAKKFSAQMKRWVLEDYYGYPPTASVGWPRIVRRILLWPDKTLRELKGRHPLPWRGEGKVLDVGCGAGGNLKALQDQGWEPSGIEISEVAAAHAREIVTGNIHTGTLESAPFSPQSFDLILMSHSLEHLPSPVDALRQVHRLLKDNGLLIVSVPNVNSLEFKLFGPWWFHLDPPRHIYHFDRHSLSGIMAQAGFWLTRVRTGVTGIFFMASVDRFWKHRFQKDVPFRKLIDLLIARPVSLIAGHLGYGTEITAYAVKQQDGVSTPPRAL
ncbi:MAG: class I SAM-dependent methyltransferase [Nitrospiraceae bacterium]